jgi:hypothetical protein
MPTTRTRLKISIVIGSDLLGSEKYIVLALEDAGFETELICMPEVLELANATLVEKLAENRRQLLLVEILPRAYPELSELLNNFAVCAFDRQIPVARWGIGDYLDELPLWAERDWVLFHDHLSSGPIELAERITDWTAKR